MDEPRVEPRDVRCADCADRLTCWTVGPPGNSSPTAAVTTDGGVTWTPQTVPGRPGASAVYGGLADVDCPTTTTCVAVGNDNNVPEEIVNTHDGGTTWIRRSTPVSVPSQPWPSPALRFGHLLGHRGRDAARDERRTPLAHGADR